MKVSNSFSRVAISKGASVGIIVILIVAAGLGIYYYSTLPTKTTTTPTTSSSSTTTSTSTLYYGPKNSSVLVDDACQVGCASPDSLDPGTAFFGQDGSYLTAVFQDLAGMNGSNGLVALPVESSGWTVGNNSQQYVFTIRPDVYFSNGDNVTAYTIWFSYVREVYMNAPSLVALSNWNEITINSGDYFSAVCGNLAPFGLIDAISSVEGWAQTSSNCGEFTTFLNSMLSNYDPATNATQRDVVSYPDQAYVANSSMSYVINTLRPYGDVVLDLAGFSGTHTVDPAFVDAHGGVQNNTNNLYLASNCEPGTGPYICASTEGPAGALTEVILEANPHYWAKGSGANGLKPSLKAEWFIAPPKIPIVEIEYGIDSNPTLQYSNFGSNIAQISGFTDNGISQWNSMWAAFQEKQYFTFDQIVKDYGPGDFSFYLGMDTQRFPTNNTDFRLAVVNVMNYTALAETELDFNGTSYGSQVVGPGIPPYGALYNPLNLPLQTQDINKAATYLNEAGIQDGFYTIMPNGTKLGDTSGTQLGTQDLYYIVPATPAQTLQLEIYEESLALIGINAQPVGVTSAVFDSLSANPLTAPAFNNIAWGIDYPDPFYNQYLCFYTTDCGITTYINNATLASLVTEASFSGNSTFRMQVDEYLYKLSAQEGYYVWLPYPDLVDWVQPYLQGVVQNIYVSYYYNLMYYSPVPLKSS